jgi:hypothetical protein
MNVPCTFEQLLEPALTPAWVLHRPFLKVLQMVKVATVIGSVTEVFLNIDSCRIFLKYIVDLTDKHKLNNTHRDKLYNVPESESKQL